MERVVASHGAEDIGFLRECYGPISYKCRVFGCLRYVVGFETLRERDDHVRSHNRPSKCPEGGCFYGEVGFATQRTLDKHISLCHADRVSNRFVFPKLRKPPPPAKDERERFRAAIRREDLGLLRDMIHTNGSLKGDLSPGSYTGLGYAAFHGKLKSIRCLLECGCNINADSDRGTALHAACYSGQTEVVQFLLSNSISEYVDREDKEGRRPLSWAATESAADVVEVDVKTKDNKGRTALSWAVSRGKVDLKSVSVVKILLEQHRVDVEAKDDEGRTPFSWAAYMGAADVVELLLERGVAVDAKDNKGRTPLSWAASRRKGDSRSVSVVKILLEQLRVDVEAKDDEGRTPLSWAAYNGAADVVKLFLERGVAVDVNAKDNKGRTPLSWAASRRAVDSRSVSVVKILLEQLRVDVEAKDDEGRTPFSWVAYKGAADVVELFLERGVAVDVNAKDNKGRTPLSWAASRGAGISGSLPVLKILLGQHRVDVDTKDDEGRTPLSWAASEGVARVVELFMGHGVAVDVNAKDKRAEQRSHGLHRDGARS